MTTNTKTLSKTASVRRQAAPTRARPPSPSLVKGTTTLDMRVRVSIGLCFALPVRLNVSMDARQFGAIPTHPPSVLVFFFFSSFSFSFSATY